MKPTTILALVASLTLTAAAPGAPPITIAENGLVMKAIEKRMAAPEPGQQPYPRPGPGGSPGEPVRELLTDQLLHHVVEETIANEA